MVTITRVAKDARFFTNMSNARRALKKVLDVDTATANSFIHQEPMEDGGRYWFSESAVNKAANDLVEADKATVVEVTTQPAPTAPAKSKTRSETRNGVRRQLKVNAQTFGTLWIICCLMVCQLLVTSVTLRKLMVGILIMQRLNSTHGVNSTGSIIKGATNYVLLISVLGIRCSNSCGSVLYGG